MITKEELKERVLIERILDDNAKKVSVKLFQAGRMMNEYTEQMDDIQTEWFLAKVEAQLIMKIRELKNSNKKLTGRKNVSE